VTDPGGGPDDPRVGTQIASVYRVDRLLGRGGFGAVYAATHTLLGHRVAIKLLRNEYTSSKEAVRRFQREARAASSIGHPHIVDVKDLLRTDDGDYCMILELLEGHDLEERLERGGPMVVRDAVHVFLQVCDGLSAVHDKGIVHRDLKPSNIFLTIAPDGEDPSWVKILDFGISKAGDLTLGGDPLTQTGAVLGTPHYMSPEQVRGVRELDHRTDIYSLGVMLFEALTCTRPFEAPAFPPLCMKICIDPAPKVARFRKDVPPALSDLVHRMMSKEPEARPQTCAEVADALRAFADVSAAPTLDPDAPSTSDAVRLGEAATEATSAPPMEAPKRSSWLLRGGLAAAGLLLLGGLALSAGLLDGPREAAADPAPEAAAPPPEVVADEAPEPEAEPAAEPPPLEVRAEGGEAELWVDGAAHGTLEEGAPRSLRLPAGRHVLEARRGDRVLVRETAEVSGEGAAPVVLALPASPSPSAPRATRRGVARRAPDPQPADPPASAAPASAAPAPTQPAEPSVVEVTRPRVGTVREDEF